MTRPILPTDHEIVTQDQTASGLSQLYHYLMVSWKDWTGQFFSRQYTHSVIVYELLRGFVLNISVYLLLQEYRQ